MFTLRLLSGWNPWFFVLLAVTLAGGAWVLYRRELRSLALGSVQWLLPLLRSLAIFLIVLTLAEPAIESRHREGEPGHVHFLLDSSNSMSIVDPLENANEGESINRFQRATAGLVARTNGLIDQLSDQFDISIWRAGESDNTLLWKSGLRLESGELIGDQSWIPNEWSSHSALGDRLQQLHQQVAAGKVDADVPNAQTVIVMMSDGQSNFGSTLQAAGDELAKSGISVNNIGFGPEQQQRDLVVTAFEVPERLFKTDQLSGRIIVADMLELGTDYQAQILWEDEVVWQRSLQAQSEQQREIRFDLPLLNIYQSAINRLPNNVHYNTLALKLTAKLVTAGKEQSLDNNRQEAHLTVGASKAQVLLVDGRSRWESRYIKNLFSRDPAWQINSVIADDAALEKLPQSRSDWQEYHLVILGDVPAATWNSNLQAGLIEFVNRGGGLIVSDGARKYLHGPEYATLAPLLPVRLHSSERPAANVQWSSQLTLVGQQLAALNLVSSQFGNPVNEADNAQFWKQLPKLEFIQPVSLGTGSETLVEIAHAGKVQPLMVARRFGAGQVLYLASDETWRWRYKVADQVHQRLWNQLARWAMRKPMSIESEFLSLDTGKASYLPGSPIEIRAALRQQDGSPADTRRTVAVISRDGQTLTRVNLMADESNPGFYSSFAGELPVGNYQVAIEAEGYTKEALQVQSSFSVIEPNRNTEMLSTSCNRAALKQVSQITAGVYLHESQLDQLPDFLRPLSGGKIVYSTRLIWQSYYWFFAALGLLAIEWVLRKRAGLI